MYKEPIFSASAATENSAKTYAGSDAVASVIVLEVVGSGWTGVIKAAARVVGRGSGNFDKFVSIKNRNDDTVIDGDTGITADGIYEINTAGLEIQFQHTRTAGSVSAHGVPILG